MLASRPTPKGPLRPESDPVLDPGGRRESWTLPASVSGRIRRLLRRVPVRMRRRASLVEEWLARRGDTSIGRLSLRWFRAYFEASRNSGCAATIYLFLSVAPVLLAATGLFYAAGGDVNVVARHLIERQHLNGGTASLVRETFGSASHNALAASVAGLVGVLLWATGIGQIYQDIYARAWRVEVRTLSDQARFAIWFFVVSSLLGLYFVFAGTLEKFGWEVAAPVYLAVSVVFWLWTPRYLLHGKIGLRRLLPGALLATLVLSGATATSPLFLGPWLNSDGRYFGSFGVVIALLAWAFILSIISIASAVFSPVWYEWRAIERHVRQPSRKTEANADAGEWSLSG